MGLRIVFIYLALSVFFITECFSETRKVCFSRVCVKAELADNPALRAQGLMFRGSLGKNCAMLFVFEEEGQHNFWMKNMSFPLDIIWINSNKEIVDISYNVVPCKELCEDIRPGHPVKYVLEVNAGFTKKNKVKIGDKVKI